MSRALIVVVGMAIAVAANLPETAPERVPAVIIQKLPGGAIQPQAVVDSKGVVHIVFFRGRPEAGDLYYYRFRLSAGAESASEPIRVNSRPGSSMATGTIRTEQIAIGKNDSVHIVWNGLGPKNDN